MDTNVLLLEERFKQIYFDNKDRLYHFVKKFSKDPSAVEDLVQECFINIWNNLAKLKDDESIYPLLRTYAHNIVINYNQKEARRLLREQAYGQSQPEMISTEEELLAKDSWRSFHETINAFPDNRRRIFLLKRQFGYTHREIAEQLNLSVKSIEKHLSKANEILRDKFAADKLVVLILLLSIKL